MSYVVLQAGLYEPFLVVPCENGDYPYQGSSFLCPPARGPRSRLDIRQQRALLEPDRPGAPRIEMVIGMAAETR